MSATLTFLQTLNFFITIVRKSCIILPVLGTDQLRGNRSAKRIQKYLQIANTFSHVSVLVGESLQLTRFSF